MVSLHYCFNVWTIVSLVACQSCVKERSNKFFFYACVSTKINIVYIVYNVCKYWFHTK